MTRTYVEALSAISIGTLLFTATAQAHDDPLASTSRDGRSPLQRVAIDVLPDRELNRIDLRTQPLITIAILASGDAGAPGLDVRDIDPSSLTFGPDRAPVVGGAQLADVDDDGIVDLSVRFEATAAGLSCGEQQVWLRGRMRSGEVFVAVDSVRIVSCAAGSRVVVIDFELFALEEGEQLDFPTDVPVQVGDYVFTPGPNDQSGLNDSHYGKRVPFWGDNGTHVTGYHDDIVMTRVDLEPFRVISFDLAGFAGGEVPFTVRKSSLPAIGFTPDGIADGRGGFDDFETFTLPADFRDTSITWEHTGEGTVDGSFHLDNIVVEEDCSLSLSIFDAPVSVPRGTALEFNLAIVNTCDGALTFDEVMVELASSRTELAFSLFEGGEPTVGPRAILGQVVDLDVPPDVAPGTFVVTGILSRDNQPVSTAMFEVEVE